MSSLVLAVIILAQAEDSNKNTVKAGSRLTEMEWFIPVSDKVLRLEPKETWSRGRVWFFDDLTAWRGTYIFGGEKLDEDVLLLQVGFLRKYIGTVGDDGDISWRLDEDYQVGTRLSSDSCSGAVIEIQLEDRSVPEDKLTTTVTQIFFVDKEGSPTVKTKDLGLLDTLRGESNEYRIRKTRHFNRGDLWEWTREPSELSAAALRDPPPGYKSKWLRMDNLRQARLRVKKQAEREAELKRMAELRIAREAKEKREAKREAEEKAVRVAQLKERIKQEREEAVEYFRERWKRRAEVWLSIGHEKVAIACWDSLVMVPITKAEKKNKLTEEDLKKAWEWLVDNPLDTRIVNEIENFWDKESDIAAISYDQFPPLCKRLIPSGNRYVIKAKREKFVFNEFSKDFEKVWEYSGSQRK